MIELNKVNPENVFWIKELVKECHCQIKEILWQSKYNDYVRYSYEPFCTDGFIVYISIDGSSANLRFFNHLYLRRLGYTWYFTRCFELPFVEQKKEQECLNS